MLTNKYTRLYSFHSSSGPVYALVSVLVQYFKADHFQSNIEIHTQHISPPRIRPELQIQLDQEVFVTNDLINTIEYDPSPPCFSCDTCSLTNVCITCGPPFFSTILSRTYFCC